LVYYKMMVIIFAVLALILDHRVSFAETAAPEKNGFEGTTENQVVERVDHIILVPEPEKAKALYDLFTEELRLPVAWEYKDYGEFSSGGVYFGNVSVEIIRSAAIRSAESAIAGIAFEPKGQTAAVIKNLEKLGIPFKGPEPFEVKFGNFSKKLWTSTYVNEVLPGSQIFFCEYHIMVPAEERKRLGVNFEKSAGGKLNIKSVKEVVISLKNSGDISKWNNLTAPHSVNSENRILFGGGPALKFVSGEEDGIESMVVLAGSLEKIMPLLEENKLAGRKTASGVELNKDRTAGVSIIIE